VSGRLYLTFLEIITILVPHSILLTLFNFGLGSRGLLGLELIYLEFHVRGFL